MGAAATLKKFAKSRERAYRLTGFMTAGRAKAISKIRNVAEFFSQKSDKVQLRAVMQLESEILAVLPHPESRFAKLRTDMLNLLQTAKDTFNVQNTHRPDPQRPAAT
jgi:Holliday junction resolvase RusA-like endonuclease